MPTRDPTLERTAAATVQLYDALDARIEKLSSTVEKFRDESRAELRNVEATTRNIEKSLERIYGENASEQVKKNEAAIGKLEERVRVCENYQNNLTGKLLVIGTITMTIATVLGALAVKYIAR